MKRILVYISLLAFFATLGIIPMSSSAYATEAVVMTCAESGDSIKVRFVSESGAGSGISKGDFCAQTLADLITAGFTLQSVVQAPKRKSGVAVANGALYTLTK